MTYKLNNLIDIYIYKPVVAIFKFLCSNVCQLSLFCIAFAATGSDVIKLYDLTSICQQVWLKDKILRNSIMACNYVIE